MGAYEVSGGSEGEAAKETQQSSKEGERHGNECGERCKHDASERRQFQISSMDKPKNTKTFANKKLR